VRAVERGLPITVLAELRELLREEEIERLVIPRRTLAHRRLRGEPLSAEESDRALRIARVTELATVTLGSDEKAMAWLRHEHRLLGGRKPLDLSRTEAGARLVENMLARIAWGAAV
jgi:putative toxin-antitoxin system antitoxin component (TIGR02293 family)